MTSTAAPAAPRPQGFAARNTTPVLDSEAIRTIEHTHAAIDLMRRAGKAAASFLIERSAPGAQIVLVAGPGNNGGDAFGCAAELAGAGYSPEVIMLGDPGRLPDDARQALSRLAFVQAPDATAANRDARGRVRLTTGLPSAPLAADWLVDGLFGIGLKRGLTGAYASAIKAIAEARERGAQVLALDVPSGIDADTGALVGDRAIAADFTLSFIALKPGLLTGPALDFVGELHCDTLGLDLTDAPDTVSAFGLDDANLLARPSRANAHKGSNGTLTVVGGANGMLGAALLAGRAAMRMGAGKVKLAWLADPYPQVDPLMPEVMMRGASDAASDDATALVLGCGMGDAAAARRILADQLERDLPTVVDADALNLIARHRDLAQKLRTRKAPTIITPHPAEAARLLAIDTSAVQANRLRAARELATRYGCVAILKGAGTVVDDGQRATINSTGNPLLATAGTGDVLAGMIGALLARGYAARDASGKGVCLHGAAADALAANGIKRAVATDIIGQLSTL